MGRCHPEPTNAVVKALYATADVCAAPDCRHPLYVVEHGEPPRLNSRVAHICARCEGGPRWDATQTAEDNRAAGNLVLLCIEHAAEIDDPNRVPRYPVSVLQGWRRDQFDRPRTGRQLSDAEAREVAAASFVHQPISFSHSYVFLGGEGGRAMGAGGGGGGAMGMGATGGPGGTSSTRFFTNGTAAAAAGAGGGGGGGGPPVHRTDWTAADAPGPAPRDAPRSISKGDLRVTSLYLTHSAHVFAGLVHAWGAGWEHYEVGALPGVVSCGLVCTIHMPATDPHMTARLTAIVRDPTGSRALEHEFLVVSGDARSVVHASAMMRLHFTAAQAGIWSIAVNEGSTELGWVPLEVRVKANP